MPEVIFNGPEGRLEGRYHHGTLENPPVALALHPHPRHGGSMNNKVVYTLYRAFTQLGFSVLRFNFRGVGRSQGGYDDGVGELSDAASALDWLQNHNPNMRGCWVAGFSFGAWIALQLLMRRPEIVGFVAVAPPANVHDFSFLAPCPVSGRFIQGDADTIVPAEEVRALADRLSRQRGVEIDFQLIEGADHFFNEDLEKISQLAKNYVKIRTEESQSED